jgi:hypothetical protein
MALKLSPVCILQSGFVCTNTSILKKGKVEKPNFSDIVLVKTHLKRDETNYYCEEVQSLYESYCADFSIINKFDFREQILKFAFLLFNQNSIRDWLMYQHQSPYFTETHRAFLIQTLQFVNGTQRTMSVSQWFNLLDSSDSTSKVNLDLDVLIERDPSIKYMNANIHEFLKEWVCKKSGFMDLLTFMHAVYGERTTIRSMANRKE